jgi:hypothetical protein
MIKTGKTEVICHGKSREELDWCSTKGMGKVPCQLNGLTYQIDF